MILISFGGNVADRGNSPQHTHYQMLAALAARGVRVVRHSRYYKTTAWPDPSDPPFNNGVLAVETGLTPQELLDAMLSVEDEFGRTRSTPNAPRTLDLDLLAYHDQVIDTPKLTLPHPAMHQRGFVLRPLMDIAPDWVHPVLGQTTSHMLAQVDASDVEAQIHPETFLKPATIMGIVNVTPDSFSDGGPYLDPQCAIDHAMSLHVQGATILDIGGESTRPGADAVSVEEEGARILPVIQGVRQRGCDALISVDTRNAATMQAALAAGADIINDVTALTHDPQSLACVADAQCPVILMHMQGMPDTMQDSPNYQDVLAEVTSYLEGRVIACLRTGIMPWHIAVDVGIGFGKTLQHNLILLSHLAQIRRGLGMPVLLGASRKSFIEKICANTPADQRLGGSLAAVFTALQQGVEGVRVHDVAQTHQAMQVYTAIDQAEMA